MKFRVLFILVAWIASQAGRGQAPPPPSSPPESPKAAEVGLRPGEGPGRGEPGASRTEPSPSLAPPPAPIGPENEVATDPAKARTTLVLVLGAPGEPEFGASFNEQLAAWRNAGQTAGCNLEVIGDDGSAAGPAAGESTANPVADIQAPATNTAVVAGSADLTALRQFLEAQAKDGFSELWIVLIGHGTFDGKEAKFNLRGEDLSASDLAAVLQPFTRPVAVINTASASAPFLPKLAGPNRVVITATRSGHEQNFTRLGKYLAAAIMDSASDLDQDGQTSLLEAFLMAAYQVADFYKTEGRLATEHPLIDDNGDGLGTPADWFRGLRATRKAKDNAPLDGLRAHQFHLVRSAAELALEPAVRAHRDEIEQTISRLKETKGKLPEDEYYRRLEPLLLDLAHLYEGSPADTHEAKP